MSPATYARHSPSSFGIHSSRVIATGELNRKIANDESRGLSLDPSQNSKLRGIDSPKLELMTGRMAAATSPVVSMPRCLPGPDLVSVDWTDATISSLLFGAHFA